MEPTQLNTEDLPDSETQRDPQPLSWRDRRYFHRFIVDDHRRAVAAGEHVGVSVQRCAQCVRRTKSMLWIVVSRLRAGGAVDRRTAMDRLAASPHLVAAAVQATADDPDADASAIPTEILELADRDDLRHRIESAVIAQLLVLGLDDDSRPADHRTVMELMQDELLRNGVSLSDTIIGWVGRRAPEIAVDVASACRTDHA